MRNIADKNNQVLFTVIIFTLFAIPLIAFIVRGINNNATPDKEDIKGQELELLEINPGYERTNSSTSDKTTPTKRETEFTVNEPLDDKDDIVPTKEEEPSVEEEKVEEEKKYAELKIKSNSVIGNKETDTKIVFDYIIENSGQIIAKDIKWEWYFDEDKDPKCKKSIKELEPGKTEKVSCDYTFEKEGNYDVILKIDTENTIEEKNEHDNTRKTLVKIKKKEAPDLIIEEYSFDPMPKEGEKFKVSIGIKNIGNKATGRFTWQWKADKDTQACKETINELASNSTKVVVCEYTYDSCGDFKTSAFADIEEKVDELDEDNNDYTENINVKCK